MASSSETEEREGAAPVPSARSSPCVGGSIGPTVGTARLELGRDEDFGLLAGDRKGGPQGEPSGWGEERAGLRAEREALGPSLSLIHCVAEPPPASVSSPASSAQKPQPRSPRAPCAWRSALF